MTAPSIRSELAAAVREVNARFNELPRSAQAGIDTGYNALDRELDLALNEGDDFRARAAIAEWRDHNIAAFRRAAS